MLQDRPTAIPEVLILVEKSAPFPRQSHARDAVLCEMFMLCLLRWYGRQVSLPARASQSRQKSSYQFQCDTLVYIMAGPGVFRFGWCNWLTNTSRFPACLRRDSWYCQDGRRMSNDRSSFQVKVLYVDVGEWSRSNLEAAQQGPDDDAVSEL